MGILAHLINNPFDVIPLVPSKQVPRVEYKLFACCCTTESLHLFKQNNFHFFLVHLPRPSPLTPWWCSRTCSENHFYSQNYLFITLQSPLLKLPVRDHTQRRLRRRGRRRRCCRGSEETSAGNTPARHDPFPSRGDFFPGTTQKTKMSNPTAH